MASVLYNLLEALIVLSFAGVLNLVTVVMRRVLMTGVIRQVTLSSNFSLTQI